jgi:aldose sugar dehydrogenase
MYRLVIILCLALVLWLPGVAAADMRVERVGPPFDHPWGLDFLTRDTVLVTERSGKLFRVDLTNGERTEISGVPPIHEDGQGGLLDVMVEGSATVWLCYTAPRGDDMSSTAIGRGQLDGNALTDFSRLFLAEPAIDSGHHFGCRLGIMPDGKLVATLGERGNRDNAQDPMVHPGSVIRLNKNGSAPNDNPYSDGRAWLPELFSMGNRNPQGLAIHPISGELWIHEHGPKGGDEINIVRGGENFGWPIVTYGKEYVGGKIGIGVSAPGYTDPIHHWTPSIAPSGMAFYTGSMFPSLKGKLLVGSLKFRFVSVIELDGERVVSERELLRDQIGRIRDVAVGIDGAIYLLTDQDDGGLWRLSR